MEERYEVSVHDRPNIIDSFNRYISSTTTGTMAATRKLLLSRSVCLTNPREKNRYLGWPGCPLRISDHH